MFSYFNIFIFTFLFLHFCFYIFIFAFLFLHFYFCILIFWFLYFYIFTFFPLGIRNLENGFDNYDPRLADFVPKSLKSCSNIQDNPIHETLKDKLIGIEQIIFSRKVKFLAISTLTFDFLETTGFVKSHEGQLENNNLLSLITNMGQFGLQSNENIESTFIPPVRSSYQTELDYKIRFMQYIRSFNDRSSYSLACVLDGVCPVNYKDQIVKNR